jgi:hypothetical protein
MKYIFTAFIVSFSLLSFFGCVKQTIPPSNQPVERGAAAPVFKTVETKDTIVSELEINGQKPQVEIVLSLLAVDAQAELTQTLYQILYNGKEPEEYKNNVIGGWKAEYNGLWNTYSVEEDTPLAVLSGEYYETITVPFQYPQLVVLKREIYEYKGGAHGNSECEYFTIDLEKNSVLKLEDVLAADAQSELIRYLEEALRDYAATTLEQPLAANESITEAYPFWEEYWNNRSQLPENFFLTKEGLGINWNPYDIAPYAYGAIEITLPYDKIEAIISEQGHTLINTLKE